MCEHPIKVGMEYLVAIRDGFEPDGRPKYSDHYEVRVQETRRPRSPKGRVRFEETGNTSRTLDLSVRTVWKEGIGTMVEILPFKNNENGNR